jgi:hypothetical protein
VAMLLSKILEGGSNYMTGILVSFTEPMSLWITGEGVDPIFSRCRYVSGLYIWKVVSWRPSGSYRKDFGW